MDYKIAVALEKIIEKNVAYDYENEIYSVSMIPIVEFIDLYFQSNGKHFVAKDSDNE